MEALTNIYNWFLNIPWQSFFYGLRTLFVVLDIAMIALFIYVFKKSLAYRPRFVFNPQPRRKVVLTGSEELKMRWNDIVERAFASPPQSFTLGLIEADSFVDDVLKKMNLPGEHMADRLERLASRDLKSIEKLWRAHRIRNDLVHTPGFGLDPTDAKRVLEDYEAFLKEIGIVKAQQ